MFSHFSYISVSFKHTHARTHTSTHKHTHAHTHYLSSKRQHSDNRLVWKCVIRRTTHRQSFVSKRCLRCRKSNLKQKSFKRLWEQKNRSLKSTTKVIFKSNIGRPFNKAFTFEKKGLKSFSRWLFALSAFRQFFFLSFFRSDLQKLGLSWVWLFGSSVSASVCARTFSVSAFDRSRWIGDEYFFV